MFEKLLASVLGLTVAAMVTVAEAAMFYTDQLAFDAAVGGHLAWSENFEGFAPGVLPAGPLSIGGGQAEIFTDGPQQIITQTATGNIAYWNVEDSLNPSTVIRGPASTSLFVTAFSFNYNMGGVGNNLWEASFVSSQGMSPNVSTLNTFLVATSVSYPLGENGEDVPLFLGWIGGPGERLHQVTLAPPATGIVVDNIQGYAPGNRVPVLVNPLPGALPLLATGLGALGLLGWWRKRKQVAA